MRRRRHFALLSILCLVLAQSAAAQSVDLPQPTAKKYSESVARGIAYLRNEGQAADGAFTGNAGIGPTAIIATALLRHGLSTKDPMVAKAVAYVADRAQEDGGVYTPKSRHRNYETCVAVMCLAAANSDGKYNEILNKAEKFLHGLQFDPAKGYEESSPYFGGAGYGGDSRPDLSNTAFLIDALKSAGAGSDDEALQRALVFVSRCQNLESEFNTTAFAAKVNDGGFYYTCAAGEGDSSRQAQGGGLRSYGSMTYAGLKSMIYAGVEKDDVRVKAAADWIRKNYTLESNPGMGTAGLFYYYHTFAKGLAALGMTEFKTPDGRQHDWRSDLVDVLSQKQQSNGAWVNDNPRWLEGDANLVTGFALLSLSYCQPTKKEAGETQP